MTLARLVASSSHGSYIELRFHLQNKVWKVWSEVVTLAIHESTEFRSTQTWGSNDVRRGPTWYIRTNPATTSGLSIGKSASPPPPRLQDGPHLWKPSRF